MLTHEEQLKIGDLVCDEKHRERQGYVSALLHGHNSKQVYIEIRWLNFPWGNPHTRTLETPENLFLLAKGSNREK